MPQTIEYVEINGELHQFESKPITILTGQQLEAGMHLTYPHRQVISVEDGFRHIEDLAFFQEDTERYFRVVVKDYPKGKEFTPETMKREGTGFKGLVGTIDFITILRKKGVPFVWRFPEAFLHPKYQCELADLLILWIKEDNEDSTE